MTYCLGIKIRDGLIGLSDGRITSGSQLSAARKVTIMGSGAHRFFIMNSGSAQRARQDAGVSAP